MELPSIFLFSSNKYLIPDIDNCNSSYHSKYQLALINDGELFINEFGGFFSRIHKKNGCHRYYVTYIEEQETTSVDYTIHIFYKFSSVYLGSNLQAAMTAFMMDDGVIESENLYHPNYNRLLYCDKFTFNGMRFKQRSD